MPKEVQKNDNEKKIEKQRTEAWRAIYHLEKYEEYRYIKHIRSGVYGVVFKMLHDPSFQTVAVKCTTTPGKMELDLWLTFDDPNIVKLLDIFRFRGFVAYVMPMYRNDLFSITKRDTFYTYTVSFEMCRCWLRDILLGLVYLHKKGLCHLDLKLENIYLSDDGCASLADFSVMTKSSEVDESTVFLEYHKPPEFTANFKDAFSTEPPKKVMNGAFADMWEFGILAIDLLTKRKVATEKNSDISVWLYDIHPFITKIKRNVRFVKHLLKKTFKSRKTSSTDVIHCHDFLNCILNFDPSKRITAERATEFPFLQISWPEICGPTTDTVKTMRSIMLRPTKEIIMSEEIASQYAGEGLEPTREYMKTFIQTHRPLPIDIEEEGRVLEKPEQYYWRTEKQGNLMYLVRRQNEVGKQKRPVKRLSRDQISPKGKGGSPRASPERRDIQSPLRQMTETRRTSPSKSVARAESSAKVPYVPKILDWAKSIEVAQSRRRTSPAVSSRKGSPTSMRVSAESKRRTSPAVSARKGSPSPVRSPVQSPLRGSAESKKRTSPIMSEKKVVQPAVEKEIETKAQKKKRKKRKSKQRAEVARTESERVSGSHKEHEPSEEQSENLLFSSPILRKRPTRHAQQRRRDFQDVHERSGPIRIRHGQLSTDNLFRRLAPTVTERRTGPGLFGRVHLMTNYVQEDEIPERGSTSNKILQSQWKEMYPQ